MKASNKVIGYCLQSG